MENQDRELLELAAKAAGLSITGWNKRNSQHVAVLSDGSYWQPLFENSITDTDGDALRLAVTLGMRLTMPKHKGFGTSVEHQRWAAAGCTAFDDDVFKQTRRAIVRAAAEIGRGME